MARISVVLNTYNAEQHLRKVLESVKDFDEIVICDMESTDSTLAIAKEFGCKIVTFPKGETTICEPARNMAISSASNSWVLLIDADEVVPNALREYLYNRVEHNPDAPALRIGRINHFMGKPYHGGPDRQLRFFRKETIYWPPEIHSKPILSAQAEDMPSNRTELFLLHLNDSTISDRVTKLNVYSSNEVVRKRRKRYGFSTFCCKTLWVFLQNFFIRKGFKDGKRGFIRSYLESVYCALTISKVIEWQLLSESYPQIQLFENATLIHSGRNNIWRIEINGEQIAIKEFHQSILKGIIHKDKALLSYRHAVELYNRGFDTPKPIGFKRKKNAFGRVTKSCYISIYDPKSITLADALSLYGDPCLQSFAVFVVSLHQAGVLHKDLNNTNVRVKVENGEFRFSLIDLNRMIFMKKGKEVSLKDSFANITRFSCMDDTFKKFTTYYLDARGKSPALKNEMFAAKIKHDRQFERKKIWKRFFKKWLRII